MSAHSLNPQYPVIDGHVDLLYDLIRHHPEAPLHELPDAWVSLPKLAAGAVVGIAACPSLLSEDVRADITQLFCQIDWFVQKYGAEGVGIGSDLGGYDTVCRGFEDHSCFPRLAELLAGAGYPDTVIAGIMGENWYRFFSGLLADRADSASCRRA